MRKLFTLLLVSSALTSTAQKATYTFGSGALNDFSGNGHNAIMVGVPIAAPDRFSNPSCAYRFPGTSTDYLLIPFHSDFNIPTTGAFSISLWYKGGTPAQGDFETLFGKGPYNGQNIPTDYHLGLYDLNKPSAGATFSPVIMPTNAQPFTGDINGWTHLVLIYNDSTWSLYINNTICGTCTTPPNTAINVSNDSLYIGRWFSGSIDDIDFYNVAISVAQINLLYNFTNSCHGTEVNTVSTIKELELYPDPATDVVYIKNNIYQAGNCSYSILNTMGKVVRSGSIISTKEPVPVNDLAAGLYFVKISEQGNITSLKFLKN